MYSFVVYLYVSGSGSITSVGEERANLSAVVSVWRGFLFLWVLGMGYVILFWHSLSLPYNYLVMHSNDNTQYREIGKICVSVFSLTTILKQSKFAITISETYTLLNGEDT